MSERAIVCAAWEVRAFLVGTKTQLRRPVRWPLLSLSDGTKRRIFTEDDAEVVRGLIAHPVRQPLQRVRCPLGGVGGRLWVQETWWQPPRVTARMLREGADTWPEVAYDATETDAGRVRWRELRWRRRSASSMPRWASRITLEVVDVRAQRVQEISREDAIAEGARCWICGENNNGYSENDCACFHTTANARDSFAVEWDERYDLKREGKRMAWSSNPWVWARTVRVVKP